MAKHLIAFSASSNVTALTKLTPVADQTMNYDLTGKTFTVPALNYLVACYGSQGTSSSPGGLRYQFQTPSLKSDSVPINIDQIDVTSATYPGEIGENNGPFQYFGDNPIALKSGELIEADVITSGGTAAQCVVLAWLDDLNPSIVTGKPIIGARATSSTTVVANTWTACVITFDNTLPVGGYAIIGMHVIGLTAYAARLILPGASWRMGVIPSINTTTYKRPSIFRNGRWGSRAKGMFASWGSFLSTSLPQIEMLCFSTDSAQTILFDLIKIS